MRKICRGMRYNRVMALNYIGSKHSLLDFLEESIDSVVTGENTVFCDLFAGTGAVGGRFKEKGYSVMANDIQYYSYVINRHRIGNHRHSPFLGLRGEIPILAGMPVRKRGEAVCESLNGGRGARGFIYRNYCPGGTRDAEHRRQYFSDGTGMRCDAIRRRVEEWKRRGAITDDEYYFLLASLLESMDQYANTASVYGAFLKRLKGSAAREFVLRPSDLTAGGGGHAVYNEDVNELAKRIAGDIAYLDPPYNGRQYSANYHLLETVARYDNPTLRGKTGLREDGIRSPYCSRPKVCGVFGDLIRNIRAKYIFLSYNNEGLMTHADIERIMSTRGTYGVFTRTYRRYRADTGRRNAADSTTEYLHYVICG